VEAFNAALAQVRKEPKAVQAMFAHAATAKGLVFDAETEGVHRAGEGAA
jgi:hypothetical protein